MLFWFRYQTWRSPYDEAGCRIVRIQPYYDKNAILSYKKQCHEGKKALRTDSSQCVKKGSSDTPMGINPLLRENTLTFDP